MKVIKSLNNNYAIAIDNDGNQIVVYGKGIGYGKLPKEIADYSIIDRSFYEVDDIYISMIKDLNEDVINVSAKIVDYARSKLDTPISSNVVFTLADHIGFCIERFNKNLQLKLPIITDVQQLFEKEMEIGEYSLKIIKRDLKVYLPKEEAAYIALHIINAEERTRKEENDNEIIIENIVRIIEKEYGIVINRDNFNYSRFVSHMHYLLKRCESRHLFKTENVVLFDSLKISSSKAFDCVEIIAAYLEEKTHIKLTDEEKLYLMLHCNRLCTREDVKQ